ncbi:hypothetical protein [Methylobacterium nigriterrae]|uniref:hypothetical protein n=1 Tax=Methylobacterium nigriterrae TaxID=3127512 RepID=UPI003013EF2F
MSEGNSRSALKLIPAILAGLLLRRSGVLPVRTSPPPEASEAGPGFETQDVDVAKTACVMAGLAAAALVAVAIMVWLMTSLTASQRRALPALTPQQTVRVNPPAPNLQANPYADIDRQRAAQSRRLDAYGFTDPSRQRARIPIERAMTLTVGRPLDP